MPLIVDKKQVREEILHAFQKCLEEKPLLKVSNRDIASKAGIAHSKINYYFDTKDKLLLAYIEFVGEANKMQINEWLTKYQQDGDRVSNDVQRVVKKFIKDVILLSHKGQLWSFAQISTACQYDTEIRTAIKNVYEVWKDAIKEVLKVFYNVSEDDFITYKAEAVLIIIDGLIINLLYEEIDECRIDKILENIVL